MNRRRFLQIASAAAASFAAAGPGVLSGAAVEWRNRQSGVLYRQLGRTGLMISAVVQGGNHIRPDNHRHVEYAIERGLNYIDTAWRYGGGNSEKGVARVIQGSKRERVFVASKVSLFRDNHNDFYKKIYEDLSEADRKRIDGAVEERLAERKLLEREYLLEPLVGKSAQIRDSYRSLVMAPRFGGTMDRQKQYTQLIIRSVEESLARLGTDYLDVMLCPHGAATPEELEIPEIFEAYERLRRAGKVRFLGVSTHNDPVGIMEAAGKSGHYDMVQVAYNVINGKWVTPAVRRAAERGLGVIAMKAARPLNPGVSNVQVPDHRLQLLHEVVPGDMKVPLKAYSWALNDSNVAAVNSEIMDEVMAQENLSLMEQTSS